MSTVSAYTDIGNNVIKSLNSKHDEFSYATSRVGQQLNDITSDMVAATAAGEGSAELKALAKTYGVDKLAAGKNVSSEAVVMAIKAQYDKRTRILTMISNIVDSIDQTLKRVIDKIGR